MIQLDTHVVVWLFSGEVERLSEHAKQLIEKHELQISPMVELELQYLFEVERATEPAKDVLAYLRRKTGLSFVDVAFDVIIEQSVNLSWTRDPFDRLITATAIATDTPLLTADRTILKNCAQAVWK